jgi:2'-5' RNA ligase
MARIRCFIGVDIGGEIRRNAAALQEQLARTGAGVKWVEPENMHITLLFLGDVDDRDIHNICKAIEAVVRDEGPFPFTISGIGAFPTMRRPKVIWAGVTEGSETLKLLQESLEAELLDKDLYSKEDRGYTPHLTLGRTRSEKDGQELAPELAKLSAWSGGRTMVNNVILYGSERGEGSHCVLSSHSLNK